MQLRGQCRVERTLCTKQGIIDVLRSVLLDGYHALVQAATEGRA